jgi:phosphohistidine phosphatase SixA
MGRLDRSTSRGDLTVKLAHPVALATAALAFTLPPPLPAASQEDGDVAVVYLVRHAEKSDDDPRDPALTPAGEQRAAELARVLADAGVTDVHSTPYERTLSTAEPVAAAAGVSVEVYDPGDAEAVASLVEHLARPGRHVVSGHSNTTPALVEALGGDPVSPISDDEYDRLYLVTIVADGTVSSVLLRYGEPYGGAGGGVGEGDVSRSGATDGAARPAPRPTRRAP